MATEIKYLDSENEEIQIVDEADWEMAIEEHNWEVRFEVFVKIDESKPFLTDEEILKSLGNIEKQAIERIIEKKVKDVVGGLNLMHAYAVKNLTEKY